MDFRLQHRRARLMGGAATSLALMFASAGMAQAQETTTKPADDNTAVEEIVVTGIRAGIEKRIDAVFAAQAQELVNAAVERSVVDGFNREYQRVDSFGTKVGEKTTIQRELDQLATNYWSTLVDKQGKPCGSSSYNSTTRAEYMMTKICGEYLGGADRRCLKCEHDAACHEAISGKAPA